MFDHRIMDVAAREHVGEFVANQFAHPQLPLRSSSFLILMLTARHALNPDHLRGQRRHAIPPFQPMSFETQSPGKAGQDNR
jgi:hypothetical protein